MARKLELSWFAPRRCWKKMYQGKVHYVGPRGINRSDRDAYAKALAEWKALKRTLDGEAEQEQRAAIRAKHAGLHEQVLAARAEMEEAGSPTALAFATASNLAATPELAGHPDFTLPASNGESKALDHHAGKFLAMYRTQAKLGNRSLNRADALRLHLNRLLTWKPDGRGEARTIPASRISAEFVADYYQHLATQLAEGTIAPATAAAAWTAFKQFIRWLWEREACNLPRNIDSKLFKFTVPAQEVETWALDDIKRVLDNAADRTKLYVLLGLNCGMTARDIADLQPGQVNWTKGTITRRRSKTAKHEGVPTVSYRLWPETLRLLKEQKATAGDRLLVGENGKPLVSQRMKDDGKLARTDAVRLAMRRTLEKINNRATRAAAEAGEDAPPKLDGNFTGFRRTSATLLDSDPEHRHVTELWLGHSPRGIARRHYVKPEQRQLDTAVDWLHAQLDIATPAAPDNSASKPAGH